MTHDPYTALGLSHDASAGQIKTAYRKLALNLHPDRLTRQNATEDDKKKAVKEFAEIASAYQLLSDDQRKRQYDHIYKYGGYDHIDPVSEPPSVRRTAQPTKFHHPHASRYSKQASAAPPSGFTPFPASSSEKKSTGIGYAVTNPISFVLSRGNARSAAVAGIQIPSRVHLAHPPPGGGFRLAFSSGEFKRDTNGCKTYVSKTTQFVQGKKYSRIETTTLHPDGRKEVVIEGNDYVERRVSSPPKKRSKSTRKEDDNVTASKEEPWYIGAWNELRDKLNMCHNPCAAVMAQ